jgi:hypothetical protein
MLLARTAVFLYAYFIQTIVLGISTVIGKEGNMPEKDPQKPKPPVLPDEIPLPLPPPPDAGDLEEADLPGDSTTDAPPPPPKKDDED